MTSPSQPDHSHDVERGHPSGPDHDHRPATGTTDPTDPVTTTTTTTTRRMDTTTGGD